MQWAQSCSAPSHFHNKIMPINSFLRFQKCFLEVLDEIFNECLKNIDKIKNVKNVAVARIKT